MANKIEAWFKKKKNRQIAFMILGAVCLYFWIKNQDKGSAGYSDLGARNPNAPAPGNTAQTFPTVPINAEGGSGFFTEYSPDGEITFHHIKSAEFVPKMENDGLYDRTPGLDTSGAINKLGGWNVFYAMGGAPWYDTKTNTYNKLQGVDFIDGIGTLTQYVCDPGQVPNLASFIAKFEGYNNGITQLNARCSRVQFAIWRKNRKGNCIDQPWLRPSRDLIHPSALQPKDWAQWGKFFSFSYINSGDQPSKYQNIGIFPHSDWGNQLPQPQTFSTAKVGQGQVMSKEEWYQQGRHWATRLGSTNRSVYTSEYSENAQGQDGDTFNKSAESAKGYQDVLRSKGFTNKKATGCYGEYGLFNYHGYFPPSLLKASRADQVKALTTHLYKGYSDQTGFSAQDHEYYTNGLLENCNINWKEYFWNRWYMLPYELIYLNERVKLATTLKGNPSGFRPFTSTSVESFVKDNNNNKINIEQALTGELIQYANGIMKTKMNTHPAACWDEMQVMSHYGGLIGEGIDIWEAPGSKFGRDASKIDIYDTPEDPNTQYMGWKPNGSNNFQNYVSGQNGAPVNQLNVGLKNTAYAPLIDAAASGMEALWPARNRMQVIKHIPYTSDYGGGFNPTPGSAGHHLNGFGAPNMNQFTILDLFHNKKGIMLECTGGDGGMIEYYNGFLMPHEKEMVTAKGITFEARGRKIYQFKY